MQKFRLLIITLSISLFSSYITAFVGCTLFQKDDSEILILHDAQSQQLSQMNKMHMVIFEKLLEKIPLETALKIHYEPTHKIINFLESPAFRIYRSETFAYLEKLTAKMQDQDNIHFSTFAKYSLQSEILEDFFSCIRNFCANAPTRKKWSNYRKIIAQKIEGSSIRVLQSHFLEACMQQQEQMKQWQQSYSPLSLEHNFFEEFITRYKATIAKIEKIFANTQDIDIRLILLDLFDQCKKPLDFTNQHFNLSILFCSESDYLFKHSEYFNKIYQSLNQGFKKIIVITHYAHSNNLSSMLEKLDFKPIEHFSNVLLPNVKRSQDLINPITYNGTNPLEIVEKLLKIFNHMFNDELLTPADISEYLNNKKQVSKICTSCKTIESQEQKLSICSQCKKAYYCNGECQKKDWPKHKLECKKTN